MTLDAGPLRFDFWNPRAAWFAAMYAQLAEMGVVAMGASQFFGFTTDRANRNGWLGPEGQCAGSADLCYYPCLSSLNWDDITPNPRYHMIKMLIDWLGGNSMKAILKSTTVPFSPPPPGVAGAVGVGAGANDGGEGRDVSGGGGLRLARLPSPPTALPSSPSPSPPPAQEAAPVVVLALRLGPDDRRLLAVNTRNASIVIHVPWTGSAEQVVVDRNHGNGCYIVVCLVFFWLERNSRLFCAT